MAGPYRRQTEVAGLRLRPIEDADLPFLRALYATTRADELALLVDWSEAQKQAFVDQQFEAQHTHYQRAYADASFDVVEDASGAFGRLYVFRSAVEIRLMEITLLPERRGAGVGTALTQEVIDEGREAGLPVILHVEADNPAHRLYERLGFRDEADESFYKRMRWTSDGERTRSSPEAG